ncbi:hypothetical protein ACFL47_08160 [Candidatus Latescibacterota bacterium]
MKKLISYFAILSILIAGSTAWAATIYVDGWNGLDTNSGADSDNALATIKRALDKCSNGDTIKLYGDFTEAPRDTSYSGGTSWDGDVLAQIFVDKSNLTLTNYVSNTPQIFGYSPSDTLQYVVRIDNTGNTIEKIEFDGYHSTYGDVYTHNGIYMTPDADYSTIDDCDFTNFGYEWDPDYPDSYYFYAIIGGGWPQTSSVNELQYIDITNNDFYDNEFESQGAHELYLNRASNGTFSGNDITNNGYGHPLKLRDGCHDITFSNNTVYGGHFTFLGDYPDSVAVRGWMDNSYDITVNNNTFTDPNTVLDTDIYRGPVWNNRQLPERGHFVEEFKDNTLYSFSGDDDHDVHGVACDNSSTYITVNRSLRDYLYIFKERGGPVFSIFEATTPWYYHCYGDICTTDDYVAFSAISDTANYNKVFRIKKDESESGDATIIFQAATSNTLITAMCNYNGSEFLVATVESGSAKIYRKSDTSSTIGTQIGTVPGAVDSITAMTYNHSNNRLLVATREGTSARIYLGSTQNPDSTTVYSLTSNRHIQSMTFGSSSSTVLTAIKDTSGGNLYLYEGTYTSPITTQRSSQSGLNAYGLAGYGSDWYSSLTSSSTVNRKLYWGTSSDPLDQVLFDSQWWHDSEAE